jgi:hypothetical protein
MPDMNMSPVKRLATPAAEKPRVKTIYELKLEKMLDIERARVLKAKGEAMQLQAIAVLQRVYCSRLHSQLETKENKKIKKDNGGKLNGNLPFLLTSDEFLDHVKRKEEATEATRTAKEQRKDRRLDYAKEMAEWEEAEIARKAWNEDRDTKLKAVKEVWQCDKKEVKTKGGKIKDWKQTHPEPRQSDPEFKQEPTIPKPRLRVKEAKDVGEESGEEFDPDASSEEDE